MLVCTVSGRNSRRNLHSNVQLQNIILIHSFHTTNLFHEGIISNPTHTLETNVCFELKRVQNLYTHTNHFYYKSDSEISKGKRVKIELTDDIYFEIPEFAPLQVIFKVCLLYTIGRYKDVQQNPFQFYRTFQQQAVWTWQR